MAMMKTKWECEKCGEEGEYEHDKKAAIWDVLQEIKDQHYQADRFCVWDGDMVRIIFEPRSSTSTLLGIF